MSTASLSEPRAKLTWARHHLEALNQATQTILKSYRDNIVSEFDDNTGEEVWIFHGKVEAIPVEISLLIGDCLYNLRSALDYLVWQLVLAEGNTPTRANAFPIGETEKWLKSAGRTYLRGVGATAQTRIARLKPYKGGDDLLYALHSLMNIDKHRHLHVTIVSLLYAMYVVDDENPIKPTSVNLGPVKEGAELLRRPKEAMEMNATLVLEVVFSEQDFNVPSVKAWLAYFIHRVSEIVDSFHDVIPS